MNIVVHPANLELDREVIIDTLFRHLTPASNGLRFDWVYRHNPHGQAQVWIARDTDSGTIVGTAAAFPRRMYVKGREQLGWVLGDFCMHGQYRSLGPALQLQRACLGEVSSGRMAFCYDFPSPSMMAVYRRLHVKPCQRMLRLAKPLRVDRQVGNLVKSPGIARRLSAVGNAVLASCDRRSKPQVPSRITLHHGECGEEFSALGTEVGQRYGVCIHRSAEYLNWRYLANPLWRYEMLTARSHGNLQAYAVFCQAGQDAILVDLFGLETPAIISALIHALVAILRQRSIVTVNVPISESHPWVPLLQQLGFRAREASPVIVHASTRSPTPCAVLDDRRWFLMYGDRDS